MASLSHDKKNNRWLIQFVAPDGVRRSISTKSNNAKDKGRGRAETFKGRIEELLAAKLTGSAIPRNVAVWIADLPDETHNRLEKIGLVEPRLSAKLGPFLADWFEERKNRKKSTLIVWGRARRNLLDFFAADKDLRRITEEDAERFERWLKEHEDLQETTIRKRCGFADAEFCRKGSPAGQQSITGPQSDCCRQQDTAVLCHRTGESESPGRLSRC